MSINPVRIPNEYTDEDIWKAARDGKMVMAIKMYRAKYGTGLNATKAAIEQRLRQDDNARG